MPLEVTMLRLLYLLAVLASVASCGFDAHPKSGMVACHPEGDRCCPAGYLCVGRSASSPGTCWSKKELPPTALDGTHDDTPANAYDPACVVTDWLPKDGGATDTAKADATSDGGGDADATDARDDAGTRDAGSKFDLGTVVDGAAKFDGNGTPDVAVLADLAPLPDVPAAADSASPGDVANSAEASGPAETGPDTAFVKDVAIDPVVDAPSPTLDADEDSPERDVPVAPDAQPDLGAAAGDAGRDTTPGFRMFDPGTVYFPGYYDAYNIGLYSTADVSSFALALPSDIASGHGIIRPSDGAFLYWHWDYHVMAEVLFQFVPDNLNAPEPSANDGQVVPTQCPATNPNLATSFLIAPDTSDVLLTCCGTSGCIYQYLSGAPVPALPAQPKAIGYGSTYLVDTAPRAIVKPDGSQALILGVVANFALVGIRATPTGFWFPTLEATNQWRRHRVTYDGVRDSVDYPPLPAAVTQANLSSGSNNPQMDGQGRLVLSLYSSKITTEHSGHLVIVRLDPGATVGEILFDSWNTPGVDQYDQLIDLFTGP